MIDIFDRLFFSPEAESRGRGCFLAPPKGGNVSDFVHVYGRQRMNPTDFGDQPHLSFSAIIYSFLFKYHGHPLLTTIPSEPNTPIIIHPYNGSVIFLAHFSMCQRRVTRRWNTFKSN